MFHKIIAHETTNIKKNLGGGEGRGERREGRGERGEGRGERGEGRGGRGEGEREKLLHLPIFPETTRRRGRSPGEFIWLDSKT